MKLTRRLAVLAVLFTCLVSLGGSARADSIECRVEAYWRFEECITYTCGALPFSARFYCERQCRLIMIAEQEACDNP